MRKSKRCKFVLNKTKFKFLDEIEDNIYPGTDEKRDPGIS